MAARRHVLDGRPPARLAGPQTTTNTQIAAPEAFYVMQDLVRLHVPYEQTDGGVFVMPAVVEAEQPVSRERPGTR
jgi:hypothetical protein